MKTILASLILLLCAAGFAPAHAGQTEDEVMAQLRGTTLPVIALKEEPLANVLSYLSDAAGVSLVMSPALQDANEEVKSLNLKDVTVFKALEILAALKNLEVYFNEGIVMVTTADDPMQQPYLRVYNITHLQFKTTDFKAPEVKLSENEGGFLSRDVEYVEYDETENTPDDVRDMVMQFTDEGSWNDAEGVSIEVKGNLLLVRQTAEVHEQIVRLLALIDEAR